MESLPLEILHQITLAIDSPNAWRNFCCLSKQFNEISQEYKEMKMLQFTVKERLPNGKMHGKTWYYDEDELIETNYYNDRREGICRYYVARSNPIDPNAKFIDPKRSFIRKTETYKNNRLNGPCRRYLENGTMYEFENYEDGKVSGVYNRWDDTGRLIEHRMYLGGKPHGVGRVYRTDGSLRMFSLHKDGESIFPHECDSETWKFTMRA